MQERQGEKKRCLNKLEKTQLCIGSGNCEPMQEQDCQGDNKSEDNWFVYCHQGIAFDKEHGWREKYQCKENHRCEHVAKIENWNVVRSIHADDRALRCDCTHNAVTSRSGRAFFIGDARKDA